MGSQFSQCLLSNVFLLQWSVDPHFLHSKFQLENGYVSELFCLSKCKHLVPVGTLYSQRNNNSCRLQGSSLSLPGFWLLGRSNEEPENFLVSMESRDINLRDIFMCTSNPAELSLLHRDVLSPEGILFKILLPQTPLKLVWGLGFSEHIWECDKVPGRRAQSYWKAQHYPHHRGIRNNGPWDPQTWSGSQLPTYWPPDLRQSNSPPWWDRQTAGHIVFKRIWYLNYETNLTVN